MEALAYHTGTDKSRDDHNYVSLYHMLFSPIQMRVRNITELGVASGQSLQLWTDFFPHAQVHGFDPVSIVPIVKRHFATQPRVRLFALDAYNHRTPIRAGLAHESQEIIIDDARHEQNYMERALRIWWPYVKPGGFYIIEDASWDASGRLQMLETDLEPSTQAILAESRAFYVCYCCPSL